MSTTQTSTSLAATAETERKSSSCASSLLLPAAIENILTKLQRDDTRGVMTLFGLNMSIQLGGEYRSYIKELCFARQCRPPTRDQMKVLVKAYYFIGIREHSACYSKAIPHVFNEQEPISDDSRQLIARAIEEGMKSVTKICSNCQEYSPSMSMVKQDGKEDSKPMCASCQMAAVYTMKLLSQEEQKSIILGRYQQPLCPICRDDFTPLSHVGHTDQCQRVFHYACLCNLTENQCPVCKKPFEKFKKVHADHWRTASFSQCRRMDAFDDDGIEDDDYWTPI